MEIENFVLVFISAPPCNDSDGGDNPDGYHHTDYYGNLASTSTRCHVLPFFFNP